MSVGTCKKITGVGLAVAVVSGLGFGLPGLASASSEYNSSTVSLGTVKSDPKGKQRTKGATRLSPVKCQQGGADKDTLTGHVTSNYVNIRSGPITSCVSLGQAQISHSLNYYCWVWPVNTEHSWTRVKDNNTGVVGWIRDDFLAPESVAQC